MVAVSIAWNLEYLKESAQRKRSTFRTLTCGGSYLGTYFQRPMIACVNSVNFYSIYLSYD
jgi:hypothetical protein